MGPEKSGDFMEVTEWSNGEGYDVFISRELQNGVWEEQAFSVTYGQFRAMKKMIKLFQK